MQALPLRFADAPGRVAELTFRTVDLIPASERFAPCSLVCVVFFFFLCPTPLERNGSAGAAEGRGVQDAFGSAHYGREMPRFKRPQQPRAGLQSRCPGEI